MYISFLNLIPLGSNEMTNRGQEKTFQTVYKDARTKQAYTKLSRVYNILIAYKKLNYKT